MRAASAAAEATAPKTSAVMTGYGYDSSRGRGRSINCLLCAASAVASNCQACYCMDNQCQLTALCCPQDIRIPQRVASVWGVRIIRLGQEGDWLTERSVPPEQTSWTVVAL
jgi:hypothetical protein